MITAPFNSRVPVINRRHQTQTRSAGLNRVIAAAVVNRQFCDMLLKDPRAALQKGYLGETFTITAEERALIVSIRAESLSDLAKQLYGTNNNTD